jgi:hypothetical protein
MNNRQLSTQLGITNMGLTGKDKEYKKYQEGEIYSTEMVLKGGRDYVVMRDRKGIWLINKKKTHCSTIEKPRHEKNLP